MAIFNRETFDNAFRFIKDKGTDIYRKASDTVKITYNTGEEYGNNAALTPPMGWSSWNLFGKSINENLILEIAEAVKNSGLADCGYKYINIDDCWMASKRDENGRLCGDPNSFPGGMPALVEKINALGLKAGIYSSNGTLTCEALPASLGHEAVDADTFAEWGFEYLKYDFGYNVPIPSAAPDIEKFTVTDTDTHLETSYDLFDASLCGMASLIQDGETTYMTGLSSNRGSLVFSGVNAEKEKEYLLTVYFKKESKTYRYFEIKVNNFYRYKVRIAPNQPFAREGLIQFKIKLLAGENTVQFYNPVSSIFDSAAIQYSDMGNELKRASREYAEKNKTEIKPIVYSICEWGRNLPWKWGRGAGNLWRTTPDIKPHWLSVAGIYEVNVLLSKYASVGGWNDPDMLEVGNGKLTFEENKTHFTLWCMMASPLILGNDIRKFILPDGSVDKENDIYKIITNKDMISVDQDPLGIQCRRYKTNGAEDILVKPLENDEIAVCFYNKAPSPSRMAANIRQIVCESYIRTPMADEFEVFDLWTKETFSTDDRLTASVPSHGVKAFRIKVK